jgi:tetratricopeptide (TPR) repeat protein
LTIASGYVDHAIKLIYAKTFADSLLELEKAEAIMKELDYNEDVQELTAVCCDCKANIYKELGKPKERLEMLEMIVEIRSSLNYEEDPVMRIVSYDLLATALTNLGRYEKARKYADIVIESSSSEDSINAGLRLFSSAQAYMNETKKYRKKIKDILILAREKLEKGLCLRTFTELSDIQRKLADIAYQYEKDPRKAHMELERMWQYAELMGTDYWDLEFLLESAAVGTRYCADIMNLCLLWLRRLVEICGLFIDRGTGEYDVVKSYVDQNISLFLIDLKLDKSVTVDRVLSWLEVTKQQTQSDRENALAQWLAGIALISLGKTPMYERRGARLIKTSIMVLKATKGDTDPASVAIGDEYIARYHFQKGEYDLAEHWYRIAIKDLALNHPNFAAPNKKRISDGLAECLKHK